jgi:hypothetical protein
VGGRRTAGTVLGTVWAEPIGTNPIFHSAGPDSIAVIKASATTAIQILKRTHSEVSRMTRHHPSMELAGSISWIMRRSERVRSRALISSCSHCFFIDACYASFVGGTPRRRLPPSFFNRRFFYALILQHSPDRVRSLFVPIPSQRLFSLGFASSLR